MTHDQFIASCAWAWARGCVDMLTSLRNRGLIGQRIAAAFAKTWADAIDEAMREVDVPETERIEVLHQFDDLIRS
jgi:truncated hemoglobin YjbI